MRLLILGLFLLAAAPACAADPALTAAAAQTYLSANARAPGVTVRPSGLQVKILRNGMGRRFAPGDSLQIYYTAKLINGAVIDGTTPGLPAGVEPAGTLKGLGEGLASMREGDRWELTLPPALAFGAKGAANGAVPPDQAMIFDVTIAAVTPAASAALATPNSGFGVTARNGETRAFWAIRP